MRALTKDCQMRSPTARRRARRLAEQAAENAVLELAGMRKNGGGK